MINLPVLTLLLGSPFSITQRTDGKIAFEFEGVRLVMSLSDVLRTEREFRRAAARMVEQSPSIVLPFGHEAAL